ncbi:MAG: hypothetical protein OD811_02495 [Alphaproteobacteria bacterium]
MVRMVDSGGTEHNFSVPWLWVLLLAPLYFAYKRVWLHALISLVLNALIGLALGWVTFGLANIPYAFFAGKIIRKHYGKQGWSESSKASGGQGESETNGGES